MIIFKRKKIDKSSQDFTQSVRNRGAHSALASQASRVSTAGFTLIEVMIATGLFAVIMTLGVGAVLNTNVAYKKSQDQRSAIDSIAFIVEDMARLIRTGSNFRCITDSEPSLAVSSEDPQSCLLQPSSSGLYRGLSFEKTGGETGDISDQVVYAFYPEGLYRADDGGLSLDAFNPEDREFRLTPKNIKFLPGSGFSVRGAEVGDGEQPIVFIRLVGEIENEKNDFVTPFSYQLSVTPRRIDS